MATGSGFMRGAIAGQLLSECVVGNKEHAMYLAQCDPMRFLKQKEVVLTNGEHIILPTESFLKKSLAVLFVSCCYLFCSRDTLK